MIVYLVTADHAYTLNRYVKEWAPSLANQIQTVFYEEAPWDWLELEACYVFSDIERLTPAEMQKATMYADRLLAKGFRVLNHPIHAPTRIALQDTLHAAGINPFRVYPANTSADLVFPVFLRLANSHQGSIGDLIHSRADLAQRLAALDRKTAEADDLVIVEYCDTRNDRGRYTKYSAMRVGETLVPRHAITSKQWMLKYPDIVDGEAIEIENGFLKQFPERDALDRIFKLAKIDFGRVDFGVQNGEIRVWEINTNPTFMPARKGLHPGRAELIELTNVWLMDALRTLDNTGEDRKAWRSVASRHERRRRLWWLQRKFFRRKRA